MLSPRHIIGIPYAWCKYTPRGQGAAGETMMCRGSVHKAGYTTSPIVKYMKLTHGCVILKHCG